jgi:hypothetical protein
LQKPRIEKRRFKSKYVHETLALEVNSTERELVKEEKK